MSAGGPQNSFLPTISGAMYDGVPQKILIFLSLGIQVLKPKSMILTLHLESSITFSSLMSLCATHLLWQYYRALITYLNILRASSSSIRLFGFDFKNPWVDPPLTYSMTSITYVSVSIASYSFAMCGWFSLSISLISLLTDFFLWISFIFSFS